MQRPPARHVTWRAPVVAGPSSFDELLAELQQAHLLEVQELRRECEALRASLSAAKAFQQKGGDPGRAVSLACFDPDAAEDLPEQPPGSPGSTMPGPLLRDAQAQVRGTQEASEPEQEQGQAQGWEDDEAHTDEAESVEKPGEGAAQTTCSTKPRRPSVASTLTTSARKSGGSIFGYRDSKRDLFTEVEPRPINFELLCMERHPGRSWMDLSLHERVAILREELRPRYRLLNPRSTTMRRWDSLLALALCFVAFVTPYEAVFRDSISVGFFVVNSCVDLFFILDIVLQFFLAVEVKRPQHGGTVMLRDIWELRRRYLRSWFAIDVISIIPFDVVTLAMGTSSAFWRRAKISRCLKLLKLVKLLRILRSVKLKSRWRNASGLKIRTQKLLRFGVVLLLVSHWLACLWGLTGLTLGAELCPDGDLRTFDEEGFDTRDASWVTALYLGGKTSPDTPCNPGEIYVASLHWAVMTLTSIGYGDIVPVRLEEYVIGIICMLIGGVLWAYVIGSVCAVISNVSPVDKKFETNTDLLNEAMEEAAVPDAERQTYREFLREATVYDRRVCFSEVAENFSPMLRNQLMHHSTRGALQSVYYFSRVSLDFLSEISACLLPHFFSRLEALDSVRDCLCLIDRGSVAHCGQILVHPNCFNEDFIVARPEYHRQTKSVSLTYTQLLVLTKARLDQVLTCHPTTAKRTRRYALKLAFSRAVRLVTAKYRVWLSSQSPGAAMSLVEAFAAFQKGNQVTREVSATCETLGRVQRCAPRLTLIKAPRL